MMMMMMMKMIIAIDMKHTSWLMLAVTAKSEQSMLIRSAARHDSV